MLDKNQQALLNELLASATPEQKIWLAGYMQGQADVMQGGTALIATSALSDADKPKVNIFYATETGNSKGLSLELTKALKEAGFKAKGKAVNRLKPKDISKDEHAIFLVSTHGEGDPPDTALEFFAQIAEQEDGALKGLPYAMLGLGDKSYEIFCGAATTLENHLIRLGGKAFEETLLLDVDYMDHAPGWIEQVTTKLKEIAGPPQAPALTVPARPAAGTDTLPVRHTGRGYSRLEPVIAQVRNKILLNDIGSEKQTYHIELETADGELRYAPGDSVGILLPREKQNGKEEPARLYSIASSPALHENEIHMTVALATHRNEDGSIGYGRCSHYLSQLEEGDEVSCYIDQNQFFKPANDDQDMIMIGPGTGVAPFRSFVHERAERDASGRNWLFFGEQRAHCDFLYQTEWQEHLALGTLHHLDLAFSRDQASKIYVQHRMEEKAKELVDWLEGGARLYLCGNKDPMSRDVETMLKNIIAAGKGITLEAANDYIGDLEEQGRYLKDVY